MHLILFKIPLILLSEFCISLSRYYLEEFINTQVDYTFQKWIVRTNRQLKVHLIFNYMLILQWASSNFTFNLNVNIIINSLTDNVGCFQADKIFRSGSSIYLRWYWYYANDISIIYIKNILINVYKAYQKNLKYHMLLSF